MAFTQDQYDKLTEAISQGALLVKYADKEVQYRNLSDMIRIKNMMESDLGINNSVSRSIKVTYKSGLNNPSSSEW